MNREINRSGLVAVARALAAEGARVGLTSCTVCGAALLIDPDEKFDTIERHLKWHHDTENEIASKARASRLY